MNNFSTPNLRLRELINSLNMDIREFANFIGASPGTLIAVTKDTNPRKLPIKLMQKLPAKIPVNSDWIINGTGEMFSDPTFDPAQIEKDDRPHYILEAEKRGIDSETIDKLKEIRKSLNLTQHEFAEELGVNRHNQASIENYRQNPTIYYLRKVSNKFKINLNYLIAGTGPMHMDKILDESALLKKIEDQDKIIKSLLNSIG